MSSTPTVPQLKKMVELVLADNPEFNGVEARNSDIALTILIWRRWYNVQDTVNVGRLFNLPREDNVKRVRAVFQNVEHKYLPTDPSILVKRGIEEAYWFDALGYNLTPDEWRVHHKTVKQATPPPITETEMERVGEGTIKPATAESLKAEGLVRTTKMKAIYLPKTYTGSGLQQGQEYEIELEQLTTGKPIVMVKPLATQYLNLQAFSKSWRVIV